MHTPPAAAPTITDSSKMEGIIQSLLASSPAEGSSLSAPRDLSLLRGYRSRIKRQSVSAVCLLPHAEQFDA